MVKLESRKDKRGPSGQEILDTGTEPTAEASMVAEAWKVCFYWTTALEAVLDARSFSCPSAANGF